MQKVPTRMGVPVPDRIVKVDRPESRWVIDYKTAHAPSIVGLTINPTLGNEDKITKNLSTLLIGIERIDNSSCALLFQFAVAGEVAYIDSAHPSEIDFCYAVDTQAGTLLEFYKPDSLVGLEVTVSHYLTADGYQPFDHRQLKRWRQSEEKISLEFNNAVGPMRLILRDASKYKP